MAIDIIYVDDGRGVIIRACDQIYGKELIQAHLEVYEQHKNVQQQYHLMDNSWCSEYNVTAEELRVICEIDYKSSLLNPELIKAVIESSMLKYSLTEAWQVYTEDYIHHSKSFSNQTNALVWVRELLHSNSLLTEMEN